MVNVWPNELAVIGENGLGTTYSELSDLVHSIAASLRNSGATSAGTVAVFQEPTSMWIASALAVMHIGAIYVPLDVSTAPGRLHAMLRDSKASILLVDNSTESEASKLDHPSTFTINVENSANLKQLQTATSATEDATAMILYTSGSTGTPKGIKLKHLGLRNWFEPTEWLYGLGREIVLQQSSSNFDMSFTQIATALCFGGSIYLLPRSLRGDAPVISGMIASQNITYTCATPTEYSSWLRYGSKQLLQNSNWRMAVSAGEAVTKSMLEQFDTLNKHDLRLFNMYGPTEISIVATSTELFYKDKIKHEQQISVGHPLPNYSVYVVDEYLHLLPAGVQGEIYIGGAGVSHGYVNNSKLTEERFLPNDFAAEDYTAMGWCSMHRTGDVGRWDTGRGLLIEGRASGDTQVKLRGLRVDVREIEWAIIEQSAGAIEEAVVSVRKWIGGSQDSNEAEILVAHVVFDHNNDIDPERQRHFLRELQLKLDVPQYMCPALMLVVQGMPKTSSAKLDRRAIAAWALPDGEKNVHEMKSPDNLTIFEMRLKDVWVDVLPGLKSSSLFGQVTRNTDFFHVGGTSLLLLALQSRIRSCFNIKIPLVQLFRTSTLGSMASRLSSDANNAPITQERSVNWHEETALPPQMRHQMTTTKGGERRHYSSK